jgi:maltose-binding protein MalE
MKISLFQGILFGVFGFAIVIGIFVFATHTSNTTGNTNAVGTVVIWGTLPKTGMQSALAAATQLDATLRNVTYIQKTESALPSELASAIATGNAPDLILASEEVLQSLSKLLSPIPPSLLSQPTFDATFVGEGKLFAAPGGAGYYGVPLFVDPLVLFSNHAILSSDGIAKPPETWESLTGLVPSVATLTPTRQITRGLIALGTYDNVHNARAILSALFLQTGVPISSRSNDTINANLNGTSSGGTLPGKAVLSFYTQFADPSKVSYTWNASLPESQQSFQNGDLALYLGFASEARFLAAANPNLDFTVSALPQPATSNVKHTYGLLYALMIPRGAKNPSGAYQAAVLFSGSAVAPAMASATGLAPATLGQLTAQPADPVAAVAYASALYSYGWLSPMPADTDPIFSSMITSVISGRLSPDSALSTSANALTSLLQK